MGGGINFGTPLSLAPRNPVRENYVCSMSMLGSDRPVHGPENLDPAWPWKDSPPL